MSGLVAADEEAELQQQAEALDSENTQVVVDKLAGTFAEFAGSEENAYALVTGLRSGDEITITTESDGETSTATFSDPTGKSGYGNVFISLSLAQEQLAASGISQPTAEQIELALLGGELDSTTTFAGILTLREQGMGWGEIAQSLDTKLGHVISRIRSANHDTQSAIMTDRANPADRAASKPQRGARLERPERLAKPERPERLARPDRPERPARPERPERPDKPQIPSRN